MKKLILIKLGGSVITDKGKPFTARISVIRRLAREIKTAREELGEDTLFLVGHGGGSFPHIPAAKYQTHKGNINKNSLRGFVLTSDAAIDIDRIVVKQFISVGLRAVPFSPMSFIYANKVSLSPIVKCLELGLIPLVYGDVILDQSCGFTIYSAEKILGILARKLKETYKIERIIECGDTDGVYDSKGKTIQLINSKNFKEVKEWIMGSKSTDVTGGMIHKVEESLKLAKETKIPTILINGNKAGNLQKTILAGEVNSTLINSIYHD